jgi:tetratricopeptide (TPR) repeat protein
MQRLFFILLTLWVCGSALADKVGDARALFEEGNAHFAVGEFAQAAEKYEAAYKLRPDAALLYNSAQATRLAGNNAKALILYRNYLQFYPNETNADEVRVQIQRLQLAISSANSARTTPPTGTAEHRQPQATAAAALVAQAPPPRRTPIYKKWWLWTAVGVVVAGGVVTGAVLGSQSGAKWSTTPDVGPGLHSAAVRW